MAQSWHTLISIACIRNDFFLYLISGGHCLATYLKSPRNLMTLVSPSRLCLFLFAYLSPCSPRRISAVAAGVDFHLRGCHCLSTVDLASFSWRISNRNWPKDKAGGSLSRSISEVSFGIMSQGTKQHMSRVHNLVNWQIVGYVSFTQFPKRAGNQVFRVNGWMNSRSQCSNIAERNNLLVGSKRYSISITREEHGRFTLPDGCWGLLASEPSSAPETLECCWTDDQRGCILFLVRFRIIDSIDPNSIDQKQKIESGRGLLSRADRGCNWRCKQSEMVNL